LRLKRRKDSLRDAHGEPLDESLLAELLGGLDGGQFERLFGLDHERLKLAATPCWRTAVTSERACSTPAPAGSHPARARVAREEADSLYKPRGHKAKIRALLETYAQAKRDAKERQSSPEKVHAQQARLAEQEQELGRVAGMRRALTRRAGREDAAPLRAAGGRPANRPAGKLGRSAARELFGRR